MKLYLRSILFLLIFNSNAGYSQDINFITQHLDALVTSYLEDIALSNHFTQDTAFLTRIYDVDSLAEITDAARIEYQQAANQALKKDKGLQLATNWQQNFSNPIFDLEDGLFYRGRGQVGVDWNMMRDGFLGHQKKANAAMAQWKADSLDVLRYRHNDFYRYQYNYILYLFNQAKIKVVKKRLELLNEQISIAFQLFYLKRLHWEDVLALLSSKGEVELFLNTYQTYVDQVDLPSGWKELEPGELPVFDIDIDRIKHVFFDSTQLKQSIALRNEAMDLHAHWSTRIGMKSTIRYNYLLGNENLGQQKDFLSAGLSFQVPLDFNSKDRKRQLEAQKS